MDYIKPNYESQPFDITERCQDVAGRLTRWMLLLQQFNFQFEYKPGTIHSNPDILSRIPSTVPAVAIIHEWTGNIMVTHFPKAHHALELRKAFIHKGLLCRQFCQSSNLIGNKNTDKIGIS